MLLDWSQGDVDLMQRKTLKSPLGPRDNWSTPTVLLGSAGLLIAGPWQTNGSYGCTCLYPFAYNPRDHEVFNTPITRATATSTAQIDDRSVCNDHIDIQCIQRLFLGDAAR